MKIGEVTIYESKLKSNISVVEIVGGVMIIDIATLNKIIITSTSCNFEYCGIIGLSYSYYIDDNRITEHELKKLILNLYGE